MEKKKFTLRQLDLLSDALSSYLMEVEDFDDPCDSIKDEVFDVIEMVGAYRMYRIAETNQTGTDKPTLNIPYSSIEEYFDFNTGLSYIEDVSDSEKDWNDFWTTDDIERHKQHSQVKKDSSQGAP